MEPIRDLTVVSPETASFTCSVKPGEPRAEITWFTGNKAISPSDKYNLSYEGETAKLEILNTESADAARYRIEARNKVGEVKSEATLTIHREYYKRFNETFLSAPLYPII